MHMMTLDGERVAIAKQQWESVYRDGLLPDGCELDAWQLATAYRSPKVRRMVAAFQEVLGNPPPHPLVATLLEGLEKVHRSLPKEHVFRAHRDVVSVHSVWHHASYQGEVSNCILDRFAATVRAALPSS